VKIEQDLRIVIKAAAAASRLQDRSKTDQELIAEWTCMHPAKAAAAKAILKRIDKAEAAEAAAKRELEGKFGLRPAGWRAKGDFDINDQATFQKAGGRLATKKLKFDENQVIAEYAAAKTKAAADEILSKYGIVWK